MSVKRSIYSIISNSLKHVLVVTLGVSAFLLLLYTLFSFKQTESQAERFVMNHMERLAQAGVISQNVGDIDLEIARFAQTWKETQDIDLRIDIFLNGKQISHAGQLQPFNYFSTLTEKRLQLPSGETLRVQIQMDLTGFILYAAVLLIILEGAILALFYILSKSMRSSIRSVTEPLELKVAWLKEIARDLPQSARTDTSFNSAQIAEIDDLGESIGSLTQQIVALEDHLARVNYDRGRLKMAEQVAHSIKGVIATLQLKVGKLPAESERTGLMDCIKTLSEISGDLLKSKKLGSGNAVKMVPLEPSHVLPIVRSAIATKQEQYRSTPGVTIGLSGDTNALGRFTQLSGPGLQSVLFNLLDNAVEAFGPNGGRVEVKLISTDHELKIFVCDDGKGIPEHILPSLMTEGFSYKKSDGNGVGLFHAKDLIDTVVGSISIESRVDQGTTVQVRIPLVKMTEADVQMISLRQGATLICVDDDPIIHSVLDIRLRGLVENLAAIVHLGSVSEFETWIAENGHGTFESRLYLFDFDLKDNKKTGLDLISEHGIALESILVSGMVHDNAVRERSTKMGLRYLSKDFLDVVPIHIAQAV